jgi:chromosome segregation ATPase
LKEEAERQHRAFHETEDRLSQQQAGFDLERQSWRRQLDEHARQTAEHQARLREVERLRERTGRERDALERRVEQLQGDVATSDRSRAEVQLELDQARAAGEAQRRELQAESEEQRRDVLAEAGRRIKDQEAEFAVERQNWIHRQEEHAQLAAVWESLAEEADQVQAGLMEGRDGLTQEVRRLRDQLAGSETSRTEAERGLEALRSQLEVERQTRSQEADTNRALEPLRAEAAALNGALEGTRRERDAAFQRVAALGSERDRLRARLDESEAARRESERRHLAERDRLGAALEQARESSEAAVRLRAEQAEALRVMRTELERERKEREALDAATRRNLVALRREWDDERKCWLEMLGAGRLDAVQDSSLPIPARATTPHEDSLARSTAVTRSQDGTAARDAGSITPVSSPPKASDRSLRRRGAATALSPRPQACSYEDPEAFRTHLEQWLVAARAKLQSMSANPGRPANPAVCQWLEYEIRTARDEIGLMAREREASREDTTDESAVPLQPA